MRLTPASDAEFQYVSANISVKYFNQGNVHVNCFQPHPGKGCQKEEMEQGCNGRAKAIHMKWGDPAIQEEKEVQEQQGCTQVHQDFGGIVPSQLSGEGKNEEEKEYRKLVF